MLNRVTERALDPSEVYYELIDRMWTMNGMCHGVLEGSFTAEDVERAWNRLAEQVPVIGARVERVSPLEACMVFGKPHDPLSVQRYDDVPSAWARESQTAFDAAAGPLVRCAVVEQDAGVTMLVVAHHSALDGRGLAELVKLVSSMMVDGGPVDHPLTEPTQALDFAGLPMRLADAVALARTMRDEPDFLGAADAVSWHRRSLDAPRDIGFALFELDPDETAGLLAWARSHQATVHGALSAALVRAATACDPGLGRVAVSASVDLRSRFKPSGHGHVGQAAGVIGGSYGTAESAAAIARQVSGDIRRRFDRGEGELVFALSGAGRFPVDDTADRVVRRWTEQAPPTFFLGNVGKVPEPAPEALRAVTPGLAPLPNQIAYVADASFRNRLGLSVGFDRNRLTTDPDAFATEVHSQVLALARAGREAAALR